MAQDEEKTTVEVKETKDGEETPKKGMSKLILFGGIGGGIVILGVVLALFVLKPMMSGSEGEEGLAEGDHTEQVDHEKSTETKKKKKKKKKKKSEHGEVEESGSLVYAIKDIVVNPAGTGGTRFLSVSFGFELESQELVSEFEGRELLVRDALITILSSKTIAELTNAKQKEIIRYQVKKRLSTILDTDEIEGVYYTDFVLQ